MNNALQNIHAVAPVRICDIGGWTDTWFARQGAVFNMAAAPCVDVRITTYPRETEQRVTLKLGNYNETYSIDPDNIAYDKHPLIEATIDSFTIPQGVKLEIDIFSEIPAGASVGTSAAVCVALADALDQLTPGRLSAHEIAGIAHRVETDKLKLQSGIQDQLCSAYGGINLIEMDAYPNATVRQLKLEDDLRNQLNERLVLVYIGTPHNSSEVHQRVIADLGRNAHQDSRLLGLRELAKQAWNAMKDKDLETLGLIMNQNTDIQRQLHASLVCDPFEYLIEMANGFNAAGCKVNGAGGDGGSLTILTDGDGDKKNRLTETIIEKGFNVIPVQLFAQEM